MAHPTTSPPAEDAFLFDGWFDPIESGLRTRVRGFIETLLEEELTAVLSQPRYGRHADKAATRIQAPTYPATGMVIARST